MNILVVGGAGYIGSHTCKRLKQQGHNPIVLDNLSTGHREAVKWGAFYQIDVSDTDKVIEVLRKEKVEAVMHFAAFALVGESVENPLKYYKNNVMGVLSLLNAMKSANVKKIVFSSTCAVYGIPHRSPINESFPLNPINPYGKSKWMAESVIQEFVKAHDFSATSLRYFNACGADRDMEIGEDHSPETHLIPLTLKAIHDLKYTLTIFGKDYPTKDGTCIRDYIHVNDLADAHVLALEKMREKEFAVFNLGTGDGYSVNEIIFGAEKVSGKSAKTKFGERRPGDPPVLVANPKKSQVELGWECQSSDLETILSSANKWYLKR